MPFEFDDSGINNESVQPLGQKEQWINFNFLKEEGKFKKDDAYKCCLCYYILKPPKP